MSEPEDSMRREGRREELVKRAVEAADRIILTGSEGGWEETTWLTAAVARAFAEKVATCLLGRLTNKELTERINARSRVSGGWGNFGGRDDD